MNILSIYNKSHLLQLYVLTLIIFVFYPISSLPNSNIIKNIILKAEFTGNSFSWSPDSKMLAVGNIKGARIIHLPNFNRVKKLTLAGRVSGSEYLQITWSPNSKHIAIAGERLIDNWKTIWLVTKFDENGRDILPIMSSSTNGLYSDPGIREVGVTTWLNNHEIIIQKEESGGSDIYSFDTIKNKDTYICSFHVDGPVIWIPHANRAYGWGHNGNLDWIDLSEYSKKESEFRFCKTLIAGCDEDYWYVFEGELKTRGILVSQHLCKDRQPDLTSNIFNNKLFTYSNNTKKLESTSYLGGPAALSPDSKYLAYLYIDDQDIEQSVQTGMEPINNKTLTLRLISLEQKDILNDIPLNVLQDNMVQSGFGFTYEQYRPIWSPDGRNIVIRIWEENERRGYPLISKAFLLKLGHSSKALVNLGDAKEIKWSPDSNWLAMKNNNVIHIFEMSL